MLSYYFIDHKYKMDNLQSNKNTVYNPNKWRQLLAHLGSKISPNVPFHPEKLLFIVLHKHLS